MDLAGNGRLYLVSFTGVPLGWYSGSPEQKIIARVLVIRIERPTCLTSVLAVSGSRIFANLVYFGRTRTASTVPRTVFGGMPFSGG